MRKLLSRGGWSWAVFGLLVYACTGDPRTFIDTTPDAGAGGDAGSSSGGTATGGKGGSSGAGTSGDAGGPAGDGGTSSGGTGNRGGTGGTSDGGAGSGGEGGGEEPPPPPPGRPGTALVAGGFWMKSTNYRLLSITGNGSLPVNASSTRFQLHGGIVGTTQP